MNTRKIITLRVCLILVALALGILYFSVIEIDEDMAGSIVAEYKRVAYQGTKIDWLDISSYAPWTLVTHMAYALFGTSERAVKFSVTFFFTICTYIALELYFEKQEWKNIVGAIFVAFMLIPGIATNKYHFSSTFVTLLCMLYIQKRKYILSEKT